MLSHNGLPTLNIPDELINEFTIETSTLRDNAQAHDEQMTILNRLLKQSQTAGKNTFSYRNNNRGS